MSAEREPPLSGIADGDAVAQRALALGISSMLTPTAPVHLSDTVTERLRRTIVEGHFSPGDRLREEQLAEALDVSRGPIRDALRQLEREGLVVRRRNRGAVVASLSRADVEEVYSLRLAIEPLACAWSAQNATDQDCAKMQAVIDVYADPAVTETPHQAADADLRFHDLIYAAAAPPARAAPLAGPPPAGLHLPAGPQLRRHERVPGHHGPKARHHARGDRRARRRSRARDRDGARRDLVPAGHRGVRRQLAQPLTSAWRA